MSFNKITHLVISYNMYDWMKIVDEIAEVGSNKFYIMIVKKDDIIPIEGCDKLCREAIYAQRTHDLFHVGKKLGVPKISNLGYDKINMPKFITEIFLQISLSPVEKIYITDNTLLIDILKSIKDRINSVKKLDIQIIKGAIKEDLVGYNKEMHNNVNYY